jgi:hypothetical protein
MADRPARTLALLLLILVLSLMLGACGGSGSSICSRWQTYALRQEKAGWAQALADARQFESGLPNPSASAELGLARSSYKIAIITLSDELGPGGKWHAAAKCPSPAFQPPG